MAIAYPTTIFSSNLPPIKPTITSTTTFEPKQHCISLLKSCSNIKDFPPIHGHLVTTNLINDPLVSSHILQFFISIERPDCAQSIFSQMSISETIIWDILLKNHLQGEDGSQKDVFSTYCHMVTHGVMLGITTFHFLIHACSKDFNIQQASEIHGRILKSGFANSRSLKNNLMGFYSKAGRLKEVEKLFDKYKERDVISWNTMISCYVQERLSHFALDLFEKMMVDGVKPDEITMISLISACTKLRDLNAGKKLHVYIEENGLETGGSLLNCLVDMYVKCGKMEEGFKLLDRYGYETADAIILWTTLISGYVKLGDLNSARDMFNQMRDKNLISWTTMISGYVQGGFYEKSLELFVQMRLENVRPDEVALLTALSACAHMKNSILGKGVHNLIVKYGLIVDGFLGNSLIDLYAKCGELDNTLTVFEDLPSRSIASWNTVLDAYCRSGDIDNARSMFDKMPERDVISWNTMIRCYTKFHMFRKTFDLFRKMQRSNVKPNNLTLVSLLSSCASIGALSHGIWVHLYIKKNQIKLDNMLATALVDMYGKCGSAGQAYKSFSEIILSQKNVFLWTSMIAAYAMEGQTQKVIELYTKMEETGTKPDEVTFIAVLSACSHGGLVIEGYKYFSEMSVVYDITPKIQHYGCVVDLLGRAGCLEEAVEFIKAMSIEPDASIWSSLLRASVTHKKVQIAEYAFNHLTKIDPLNESAYVLLSNLYKKSKRWDDESWTRKKMMELGIRKKPGCSFIEQNGIVHEFTSGDFSDSKSAEIYSMLNEIEERLNIKEQEGIYSSSSHHSERLAVAYGLISSSSITPIRVVNNLRICNDCHSATKVISQAYNREIVIRDTYRFHRFKDGCCSCNDRW